MSLLHPIVPVAATPPAVDPVRRVARAGEQSEHDERRQRREQRPAPAPEQDTAAQAVVSADGHLDTRA